MQLFNRLLRRANTRTYATNRFKMMIPTDPDVALGFGASLIAAAILSVIAYYRYSTRNFTSLYAAEEIKANNAPTNTAIKKDQDKQQ